MGACCDLKQRGLGKIRPRKFNLTALFPTEVIRHAVWLYFRFTLSFREEMSG